ALIIDAVREDIAIEAADHRRRATAQRSPSRPAMRTTFLIAFMQSAARTAKLVARFHEAYCVYCDLLGAVQKLEGSCVPSSTSAQRDFPDLQARRQWEAALAALREDPDAALPAS